MQLLTETLSSINDFIWGIPLIGLLLSVGIYFTMKLKFLQISKLKLGFQLMFKKEEGEGDVSSFQALCTALSSTIGTGNIVGVATAIASGGPGALFWMWVSAFLGMATKYAEGVLAIKYRQKDENGEIAGGPMYYLEKGLGNKFLAKMFAFFGVAVALLGIGTFTQVKSIASGLQYTFHIPPYISAIIISSLVAFIIVGGITRISKVAEKIVPFMCMFYIIGVLVIIFTHLDMMGYVLNEVIQSAFNFKAPLGATIGLAMQKGISRGIFSNESGLGSAPIASAAAKTDSCVEQGLVSMLGTFIDTIIVCTMTGVAIIITQSHLLPLEGAAMTADAFLTSMPLIGGYVVNIGLIFFAFTTIIGWNYYGERCLYYLCGLKAIPLYKLIYVLFVAIGPFMTLDFVFILADIVNGCMAFPNLVGLVGLRKEIIAETKEYFKEN